MIVEWQVMYPPNGKHKPRSCLIALPGRSNPADQIMDVAKDLSLPNTTIIALRAKNYEWYPQPKSSEDQNDAVGGLSAARQAIEDTVRRIKSAFGFEKHQMGILGFSAGAVAALYYATTSKTEPFAAVVSFCGAILEPENVPECRHKNMPILLVHNEDDFCFNWHERYLPMKSALTHRGYNVHTIEKSKGNHHIYYPDIIETSTFVGKYLGYGEDWKHPRDLT